MSKGLRWATSQDCMMTSCRLRLACSSPTRAILQVAPVAWPSSSAPLLMAQSVLVPPASIPRYNGMCSYHPIGFLLRCSTFVGTNGLAVDSAHAPSRHRCRHHHRLSDLYNTFWAALPKIPAFTS